MVPLYQDYAITSVEGQSQEREDRIRAALEDAGWSLADASIPPAITTQVRTHRRWGLYRVTVFLEVVPLGREHVRVLIHPYREYVWGGRTKLPYLTSSIRRTMVRELNESFQRHGFIVHRSNE